jgi:1-acyl-sn-glycerol-3-phosphate acyltransferase
MKRRKAGSTIYYSDMLNDDFAQTKLKRPEVVDGYKFKRTNPINNFFSAILYYCLAHPILSLFCIGRGITFSGKKNLKELKGKGYYVYGNHTTEWDEIVYASYICWSRRVNIVGYSDTTTIPVVKHIARALGYLPLGNSIKNQRDLMYAMKFYLDKKQVIVIYPEAHVWPYYTHIRPFPAASFHYPAKFNAPIVPLVTVYKKRICKKFKPCIKIIIGKPIYPKSDFTPAQNKVYLHDECYKQMKEISDSHKQFEYFHYEYISDKSSTK